MERQLIYSDDRGIMSGQTLEDLRGKREPGEGDFKTQWKRNANMQTLLLFEIV